MSPELDIANNVLDILSDQSKWVKNVTAQDEHGRDVNARSDRACKWCLVGAVHKATDKMFLRGEEYVDCLAQTVEEMFPDRSGILSDRDAIVGFNDHPVTTFEEVRAVLEATRRKLVRNKT